MYVQPTIYNSEQVFYLKISSSPQCSEGIHCPSMRNDSVWITCVQAIDLRSWDCLKTTPSRGPKWKLFGSTRAVHTFDRNSKVPSRHDVIRSFDNSAILLHLFYSWHQFILKVVLGDLDLASKHSQFYIKDQLEVKREYSVHATSAAEIVIVMYRRLPSSGRHLPVRHSDLAHEYSSLRAPARSMFTSAIIQALSRGMPSLQVEGQIGYLHWSTV